jgi:succinoglycan biosynthesis protein ExoA
MTDQPSVTIIVPCYNEQNTIRQLLEAIYRQSYPLDKLAVVIADGLSSDHTRQVIDAFCEAYPDLNVRVVDNTHRSIPAGLNRALEVAQGEIIVRLDAHSIPDPDYVTRGVAALQSGVADNVGGVWEIKPGNRGWIARAIAVAASHPLGVGDARYRYADQAGSVDTVPFGIYWRELVNRIGRYDETLLTNEDYEFNVRIRQAGGTVWLDPQIRCQYFARGNLGELARQYWRYGYWKLRMLQRYPRTLRWRQALPPLFVLGIGLFLLLGLLNPVFWQLLAAGLTGYIVALLLVGVQMVALHKDPALLLGVPLAIATMHLTWGTALLWSLLGVLLNRK